MLSSFQADRFANLALACVHREYPNKITHILNSDADALPPRRLTPAFYGCFDWHSAVHAHWLLVRLLRMVPDSKFEHHARHALAKNLTAENLTAEADYLQGDGRASFERPYGLAWLLQLATELHEWQEDVHAQEVAQNLKPLEAEVVRRFSAWLPKLPFPVRSGEHSQTAFAIGLALDFARTTRNAAFTNLLEQRAKAFFQNDLKAPLSYEPSGEDFLSPTLAEADVMRRILSPQSFAAWLTEFFPSIDLQPAVSPDRTDGKLAHLDGLNLSRAWMLEGIASRLPSADPRKSKLQELATIHAHAGLEAVTGEHYEGGHWLASFAVYLLTRRGLPLTSEHYPE
ncbi:MAG TPA: DUF2891 domain-containing protein [Candidatus Koribacter sp.]|jgi:hypothetical protein